MVKSRQLATIALLAVTTLVAAQELPRHPVLGLELTSTASSQQVQKGAVVSALAPNLEAAPTQIKVGDLITQIGGNMISAADDVSSLLHDRRAGERVALTFQTNGQTLQTNVTLQSAPYESLPGIDVLYRAVTVNGSRRRVIVTKPKGSGPFPAIFLAGGLGCYSLDGWSKEDAPYGHILYTLTRRGYVTMRVEKTGEGTAKARHALRPKPI